MKVGYVRKSNNMISPEIIKIYTMVLDLGYTITNSGTDEDVMFFRLSKKKLTGIDIQHISLYPSLYPERRTVKRGIA